jgi:hypothetical protein
MPSGILPDVYGSFGAVTVASLNDIYFFGLTTRLTNQKCLLHTPPLDKRLTLRLRRQQMSGLICLKHMSGYANYLVSKRVAAKVI